MNKFIQFVIHLSKFIRARFGPLRGEPAALALACVLGLGSSQAMAAVTTLFVDSTVTNAYPTSSPPGNSWPNAFKHLQDAIDHVASLNPQSVNDLVTIWVRGAAGDGLKYYPDRGQTHTLNDRRETFRLHNWTSILGGFNGTEPPTPEGLAMRNPSVNITILSGNINNTTIPTDNSFNVVTADMNLARIDADHTPHVDGVIIEHGYSSNVTDGAGAGMTTQFGAKPYLRGVIVRDNSAEIAGGIAASSSTELLLRNCTVTGNDATDGDGGGISVGFKATILNSSIADNDASDAGGGIFASVGSTGKLIMVSSTVVGNDAATDSGGGIYQLQGTTELTNCVIAQNHADGGSGYGGGLYLSGLTLKLDGCTVADNSTKNCGAGMYWDGPSSAVRNGIFWGNTVLTGGFLPQICDGSSGLTVSYTDVQGGWSGTGNINSIPKFIDAPGRLYRLDCGSLCHNAGNNSAVEDDTLDVDENSTTTGQDVPDRMLHLRIGHGTVDMGAFERHNCPGDVDQSGRVDIDDLLAIVNSWASPCTGACLGDISPSVCGGDGNVNIDDLLQVINTWGFTYPNGCPEPITTDVGEFDSVQDCMDAATEKGMTAFSPEWIDAVNSCTEALCLAEIIVCD